MQNLGQGGRGFNGGWGCLPPPMVSAVLIHRCPPPCTTGPTTLNHVFPQPPNALPPTSTSFTRPLTQGTACRFSDGTDLAPGPACAADAVNIGIDVLGQVVIDNGCKIFDVQAPRGYVRGHKNGMRVLHGGYINGEGYASTQQHGLGATQMIVQAM